jgi:alpha-tubulin suppressor-like RCC1 family protein
LVDFDDMFVPKELFLNSGLWSWGDNGQGELGLGDRTTRSSPVQVGSLTNWKQVSSVIVKNSTNSSGPGDIMFAIKTDGTLWAWGNNQSGQLGLGDTTNRSSPVQVGSLTNWKHVFCGLSGTAAIKTDGTLWVWGWNEHGQLGLGDTTNRSSPVQVGSMTNWKQAQIADRVSAIKTDGTLWVWGRFSSSSPVQVGSLTNWKQVSNGLNIFAAIKTDGTLWQEINRGSYTMVGTSTNWKQVFQSYGHAFAIQTDGTLWAWGFNSDGQLGLGDTTNRSSPVQVGSMTNWKQVAAGTDSTIAIKTDGTLWAWGLDRGQLGLNIGPGITYRSSPVQVGSLTNWKQVTVGQANTMAIQAPELP